MKAPTRLQVLVASAVILVSTLAMSLQAAERNLDLDVTGTGPFAVGSMNFTVSNSANVDAGEYQRGTVIDGTLHYINELLSYPEASFLFELDVPNDVVLYSEMAGTSLPYTGYVLYPTTDDNPRADYNVFTSPGLPHMQGPTDSPLFADDSSKYPLLVYSHGVGDHPTAQNLNTMILLASHGYIVMALYHGDARFSELDRAQFALRPLAVKVALDELMAHPDFSAHIDPDKIGGIGASFGGATMMALLGAKKVSPDPISVFTNTLQSTVIDTRIKAAAMLYPFAGKAPFAMFGRNGGGGLTIDRPLMAHSGDADATADYAMVESVLTSVPGTKYLIRHASEGHDFSQGALDDATTWSLLFLDAFIKGDADAAEQLSIARSVSGGSVDTLELVTDPLPQAAATFADNILSLNGVTLDNKAYRLELNYLVGSDPVQFGVISAEEIPVPTNTAGSFVGSVIILPSVDVAGASYHIELTLTGEAPYVFTVTAAN